MIFDKISEKDDKKLSENKNTLVELIRTAIKDMNRFNADNIKYEFNFLSGELKDCNVKLTVCKPKKKTKK